MKLIPIVLCAGLLASCMSDSAAEARAPRPNRKAPDTIELTKLEVPRVLSYLGTVVAPRDAVLSAARGGRVDAYLFDMGQAVRRGDLLVKLGAQEYDFASQAAAASLDQAKARIGNARDAAHLPAVLAAKSNLALAQDALKRAEKLHAQGSLSEQEFRRAHSSEEAARAQYDDALAQAQAEFGRLTELRATSGQARAALGEQTLRAPFDGVVLERFVEIGQMATAGSPVVRLYDPTETRVRFEVPQSDAAKVKIGSRIFVIQDGQRIAGTVVRLSPGLVGAGSTRLAEAALTAPSEAHSLAALLPGTRTMLWLDVGGRDEVVAVPRASTTTSAGLTRAWVFDGTRLHERLLSVLRVEGDRLLVRDGLRAGELLVRTPLADFRLGEEVQP